MAVPAPANAVPRFGASPLLGQVRIFTANTARDGKGEMGLLLTAGPAGCVIEGFRIVAEGTVSAGIVRFFVNFNDSNKGTRTGVDAGLGRRLFDEQEITAVTPDGDSKVFIADVPVPFYPFTLPPNAQIWVSTHAAEAFIVYAFGSNF